MDRRDLIVGDEKTREWTYNITDYANGTRGLSYPSGDWILKENGDAMFPKHSIYMNPWGEFLFEDLDPEKQFYYITAQELDILRIPLFNSQFNTIGTIF